MDRVCFRLAPLLPVLALLAGMLAGAWQAGAPGDDAARGSVTPRTVVDAGSWFVGDAVLPSGVSVANGSAEARPARSGKEPEAAGHAGAGDTVRPGHAPLRPPPRPVAVDAPALPLYRLYRVLLI